MFPSFPKSTIAYNLNMLFFFFYTGCVISLFDNAWLAFCFCLFFCFTFNRLIHMITPVIGKVNPAMQDKKAMMRPANPPMEPT